MNLANQLRRLSADILRVTPTRVASVWGGDVYLRLLRIRSAISKDFVLAGGGLEGGIIIEAPSDAVVGSAAFPGDHPVCCEWPTLFRARAKLNVFQNRRQSLGHVVTTMPGEDAIWPSDVIASGPTCDVLRVVSHRLQPLACRPGQTMPKISMRGWAPIKGPDG